MTFVLTPALNENFVDREEILRNMINTLTRPKNRIGFALVGPRRIGKSSILMEVNRRLSAHTTVVPIYFSVWDILENSVDNFCKKLSLSVMSGYKPRLSAFFKTKELLKVPMTEFFNFLRMLRINIPLFAELELNVFIDSHRKAADYEAKLEKVFMLPEKLAQMTETKCILFLDEFPSLIDLRFNSGKKVGHQIIKKIRSINEEYHNVCLNISGSIKCTMEQVALSDVSPFYRQFEVINISPFDKAQTKILLEKNLGMPLTRDVINEIYSFTYGIPFYIQALGKNMAGIDDIDVSVIKMLILNFIYEQGDILFLSELSSMSPNEKKILIVMATSEKYRLSDIAQEVNENPNFVQRYMGYLMMKNMIYHETKGIYKFFDPVFQRWLKAKGEQFK